MLGPDGPGQAFQKCEVDLDVAIAGRIAAERRERLRQRLRGLLPVRTAGLAVGRVYCARGAGGAVRARSREVPKWGLTWSGAFIGWRSSVRPAARTAHPHPPARSLPTA